MYDNSTRYEVHPLRAPGAAILSHRRSEKFTAEDMEDAFMEATLKAYETNTEKDRASLLGHAKTIAFRNKAKEYGLNQRGKVPGGKNSKRKRFHIGNVYNSETGENMIEKFGYDEKGDLVIGN